MSIISIALFRIIRILKFILTLFLIKQDTNYTAEQIAEFYDYVKGGDVAMVKETMKTVNMKELRDKRGFLVVACGHGQDEVAGLLISAGLGILIIIITCL